MNRGVVISLNAMIDFIPLIIMWSVGGANGLNWGIIISIIVVLIRGLNKNLGIMTIVVLVYFIISNIGYEYFDIEILKVESTLISYIVLSIMCFTSILADRPFTMYVSKDSYSSIYNTPLFIEMNKLISAVFGVCYVINAILSFLDIPFRGILSPWITVMAIVASIVLPGFMPET